MNPDVREINRGTILHVFLKKNLFSHVKFLIEELGMDPNKTDNQGKDALFLAVERNHFETVQYLIHERKMDPNGKHRKDDSESILSLAVKHATDLHILKYLIEEHKMDKLEALREIWRCKNFNVFKEFNEYFNTKNEKIKDGNILHTSLTLPEVIFLVEECKIDPNETDDNGNNALHKAVILGHLDIIEYYFEKCKMDPNVKNKNGQNALHLSVLHLLTVNIKNNIRENYIVEYLISIGMDKNEKDSENCNILTIAAKNYYIDLIKMLIEKYNMNPNEPDSNGKFVLYHIIDQIKKNRHHRKATYSRFSLSEEDLHEEDDEEAYINLIYLIDKCKMDPNKKDSDGKNALHHAVGTWGFIEYLIDECKMNPNEKDNDGNNVLHITAYEGRDSLEKHLIRKYGMNPNEKNNIGDTVCSIRYGSC
jgi:ankyrin repeat protein